jgi:hypothetical protein
MNTVHWMGSGIAMTRPYRPVIGNFDFTPIDLIIWSDSDDYVCLKNKQAGETCVRMSPDTPFAAYSSH